MDLVLYAILIILSRPVVCTNFQGMETNTVFLLALSVKATVQPEIDHSNHLKALCIRPFPSRFLPKVATLEDFLLKLAFFG
jgi:hypothetical protein